MKKYVGSHSRLHKTNHHLTFYLMTVQIQIVGMKTGTYCLQAEEGKEIEYGISKEDCRIYYTRSHHDSVCRYLMAVMAVTNVS